jgi:phosphoribosyl-dephospho-CoA transferase
MTPPAELLPPWRRHQLVWLDEFGWYGVLAASPDASDRDEQTQACLDVWAERRWPLVVTTQGLDPAGAGADPPLALGLPAPGCWGRRRISIAVSSRAVTRVGEFPPARDLTPRLALDMQSRWSELCQGFDHLGLTARVYGSWGWQQLTGLDHVHAGSDIDLLLPVLDARQADLACALLQRAAPSTPRIDGELAFADGRSVAWREWVRWRAGLSASLLVKRVQGASLMSQPWLEACA